jgi:hypothetical protein
MDSDSEEENPDWNRFWGYIPHQKNHTIGENVWKIGMIMNGERSRRRWIAERKRKFGRDW